MIHLQTKHIKLKTDSPIIEGSFVERLNRFVATVNIGGINTPVHVPNSGRLKELFTPGAKVLLEERNKTGRKTHYELEMVYNKGRLISVDSQIPNKLMLKSLKNRDIPGFEKYSIIEREITYGNSRFDIKMSEDNEICYMEIKGVTLEKNGVALFPDAPTTRGSKHVKELMEVKKYEMRAVLMFVIQMSGIETFTTNAVTDPEFAQNVGRAAASGVEIYAYDTIVSRDGIKLNKEVKCKI